MDGQAIGRVFLAGIPRSGAMAVLNAVNERCGGKLHLPGTEEELARLDANPHTKNMSLVLGYDGEPSIYEEFVLTHQDSRVRVRGQRLDYDYGDASEVLTMLAPARVFMSDFIQDAAAALVEGTGLTAHDVFLKSWVIVQETAGEKPAFIPVVRVMVRVQVQGTFMAKWGSVRDGTWIKTKRGFQTQVWRSRRKLREARQLEGKRPTTHSVVFVNGLHDDWQVDQLAEAWKGAGVSSGAFDVARIAGGKAAMIILAPDDQPGDAALRRAEEELAHLARVGVKIRLTYGAAPDRVQEQKTAAQATENVAARAPPTGAWGNPRHAESNAVAELQRMMQRILQQNEEMKQQIVDLQVRMAEQERSKDETIRRLQRELEDTRRKLTKHEEMKAMRHARRSLIALSQARPGATETDTESEQEVDGKSGGDSEREYEQTPSKPSPLKSAHKRSRTKSPATEVGVAMPARRPKGKGRAPTPPQEMESDDNDDVASRGL